MSVKLVAYANFAGNAREAMTYYRDVFGGELTIASFADFGMADMPPEGTMHAELVADGFTIMASDAMPGAERTWGGTRVYLAFMSDEPEKLQGWYDRLAADGRAGQLLQRQAWGDLYGDVMDKFGLEWMFNISLPEGWAQTH
jgi:PhnB protein